MIQLTPNALEQARKLLSEKGDKAVLRISVKGGGCAGFTYDMEILEKADKKDRIFQIEDITVACDLQSLPYIQGTTIDYKNGLVGAGFTFNNPNAKGSCGCGTSFNI